jgi:hypothetical protein
MTGAGRIDFSRGFARQISPDASVPSLKTLPPTRPGGHGKCHNIVMAGAAGAATLVTCAGYVLQTMHNDASLFAIASGAYLQALFLMVLFASGEKKVELTA